MRRGPIAVAALAFGLLLLLIMLIAWTQRFRIASGLIDRRLAAAQVPARYRITHIGPFLERMENVRIGDPAAPNLIARRIDVAIDYGLSGPVIRAVRVDGARMRARADRNGLSLGVLDRLLPKAGTGKTTLPDMILGMKDIQVLLSTPAGTLRAALSGDGNPSHRFRGAGHITAPALRLGACAASQIKADLSFAADGGRPSANGPVQIARLACPGATLANGRMLIRASADATFEHLAVQANVSGFGGSAGPTRFAGLSGTAQARGTIRDLHARASLNAAGLSLPRAAKQVAQSSAALAGTPLAPTGTAAGAALARLLYRADARADVTAAIASGAVTVELAQLALRGSDGAYARATAHDGMSWSTAGWRADADIVTGGGTLPTLAINLRQSVAGAPLTGIARLAPYRAGDARLAAAPFRFNWTGRRASFGTTLIIDGPVSGGFVRGLAIPVNGYATAGSAFAVGQGCQPLAFAQLQLASFTFDSARLSVCGSPIVSRSAGGVLRLEAVAAAVRLTGRTSSGAPLTLDAARLRLNQHGFTVDQLATSLGAGAQPTLLRVAALTGEFGSRIGGRFEGASGAIGNVPLILADAGGDWTLEQRVLHLHGKLGVSDAAADARFNPLVTDDTRLALNGSLIAATATLKEPRTHAFVANVRLEHDLSHGTGHALLDVPGITFTPKGLQPEKLTPLTLGVIANVAGTISGSGRIDWDAQGVTSSGTFGTDHTDLAAAFGPVSGIKGQLHFTDLLGLVSAPHQQATIAELNPGVSVTSGIVHYQLTAPGRVQVEDATWPFAGGTLKLDPTLLDFDERAQRQLTFRVDGLDAAAFVQQLDFPNISATGTFDGVLPMIFDHQGGRIEAGWIRARPVGGSLAYVGELTNAELGTMGKLAFDALKAIRYSSLEISMDGRLDGEMVSRVRFTGVREATPEQSMVTRLIRNLPFRFNIAIRAPFRGLVGSARAYVDPRLLLTSDQLRGAVTGAEPAIQPSASGTVR